MKNTIKNVKTIKNHEKQNFQKKLLNNNQKKTFFFQKNS